MCVHCNKTAHACAHPNHPALYPFFGCLIVLLLQYQTLTAAALSY